MKNIFFETSKQKIIEFLLRDASSSYYGSEIIKTTGLSEGSVYQGLKVLEKKGFIKSTKSGRMSFYQANLENMLVRQIKVVLNIFYLEPFCEKIKVFSNKITLYGSAAEGKNVAESDFDLLIITNQKDKVQKIFAEQNLNIQAVILDPSGYLKLKSKDRVFYEEVNRGIIIYEHDRI